MSVAVEIHGGVADLVITGPIDLAWTQAFRRCAVELSGEGALRVVRLTARGRFFCPGGDVPWMVAQPDMRAGVHELASTLHEGLFILADLDAPVVAAVHGPAAGAGMSLVLGADVAIAGSSAVFSMAYTGVGLSPDGGASWLLPRIVGRRAAMDIMLSNRRIAADEAASLGIVTRTVPDDELASVVDDYVQRLSSGPTASYGTVKRLLAASSQADFREHLASEADAIATLAGSPTGAEGIEAFVQKRAPAFPAR